MIWKDGGYNDYSEWEQIKKKKQNQTKNLILGFSSISSSFSCIHLTKKADQKQPQGLLSFLFYLLDRFDPR